MSAETDGGAITTGWAAFWAFAVNLVQRKIAICTFFDDT
jgi:hypothetical protein